MGRGVEGLVRQVEQHVDGALVAAGLFQPNVARLPEFGVLGVVTMPLNWRREQQAMDEGLGLAPSTLVVVTPETVYVFDAWLLGWGGVRLLLEHPRRSLLARTVPLAEPRAPAEVRMSPPELSALRLEDGEGRILAEPAPQGWGDEVKRVFRVLTGHEGKTSKGTRGVM